LVSALIMSLGPRALAEDDVLFGRSAAGLIQVAVGFGQPFALPVSVFPGISGYATGEVGFHSTVFDDPANDFYQLSTASDFRFILLAKDPGMEVWNDHGSGYMAVEESFFVGQPPFDTHPVWDLVTGTPGSAYSLTLKMRDVNGFYPDSAPFVLSFTAVQTPPVFGPYQINLSQADPLHATLSWPTNALGWALESAASVTAGNWQTITNTPDIAGTNFSLSISTGGGQQFFRLHKQ
jgi:hypothetical protein